MTETQNDTKFISKRNSGFPAYLDFDTLRSEAIAHLGNLAGRIWTDHNVHDPGITILEVLCYALLDLGYRTNLPVKDLLTRNPNDNTPDNNFLTPADILTCNPLTITDFRKLLVDIEGVKNAWLEIADDVDPESLCNVNTINRQGTCVSYLNGLYRVYLDLERNIDTAFATPEEKNNYLAPIFAKVKQALMAHRNICEDFIDVTVLCKWEIGVCAQIELDPQADPETVYLALMEVLKNFFSPAPKFYTLTELLDRKKPIEDIFAGRPRNVSESYGFVDTEEFEALTLRKEIHMSDLYNVLFSVPGIAKITQLRLRNCAGNTLQNDAWVVHIPQFHIPDFSPACTGIEFVRNGMPVSFDFGRYQTILQINREHTGKILYSAPSPMLDSAIPQGEFIQGLDTWSSIQNDFPRVYGIERGGLPQDASPLRVAQARQLQGYLLFFDHLLANYVGQMSNVRTLYALTPSRDKNNRHTYFTNAIENAPDTEALIRSATKTDAALTEGSTLATLTARQDLLQLGTDIKDVELEQTRKGIHLDPFTFSTKAERDIAVGQWQDDFSTGAYKISVVTRADQCVFYYITGSSQETAFISARYYPTAQEARSAADWMAYISQTPGTIHNYAVADKNLFSFEVVLSPQDFSAQLQAIAEDAEGYGIRRQGFLQHLLARFAESFTDYAMLSFGFYDDATLQRRDQEATEKFLASYGDISSNRGRAFDYTRNGWPGENISGFEKQFMARIGTPDLRRQSLCNFEVVKFPEKYVLKISLEKEPFFKTEARFESPREAKVAIQKIFEAASVTGNYFVQELPQENAFQVHLNYSGKENVVLADQWPSKTDAETFLQQVPYMFSDTAVPGETHVATWSFSALLKNYEGVTVKKLIRVFGSEEDARGAALKQITRVGNAASWSTEAEESIPLRRLIVQADEKNPRFLNPDRFFVDIDTTTIGKPGIITYELLDREQHRFKFRTVSEFANEKDANNDVRRLLLFMMSPENYQVKQDTESGRWAVFITDGQADIAASLFHSEADAWRMKDAIYSIVHQFTYTLAIESVPATWSFRYTLGYRPGELHVLESTRTYPTTEAAAAALRTFAENITAASTSETGNAVAFAMGEGDTAPALQLQYRPGEEQAARESVNNIINLRRTIENIRKALVREENEVLDSFVTLDEESLCPYGYRLVDKDGLMATYHQPAKSEEQLNDIRKKLLGAGTDHYNFPDLCIQGDVIQCRLGENGKTKWYHYQLRTQNEINSPIGGQAQKIVLFESVRGYTSKTEAEKAFAENYHTILLLAADLTNYGSRKPISETPLVIQTSDAQVRQDSVVFIPAATLEFLGTYPGQAVLELIKIVNSYPIKSIRRKLDCPDFSRRFLPCEPADCPSVDAVCSGNTEKPVYFFTLFDRATATEDWQSISWYETPLEALNAFRFFLFLLQYEGNYTSRCDCTGTYRLVLRQVVAESTQRFRTEEDAWGKDGIQKFINTAQQPDTFYGQSAPTGDNHRFFVACPNVKVVHPVQYDTPRLRDETLIRLYQNSKNIANWTFAGFCDRWSNTLSDLEGNPLAQVQYQATPPPETQTYLNEYASLTAAICRYGLVVEAERIVLAQTGDVAFTPAPEFAGDLEALKDALLYVAFFQPFKKQDNAGGSIRFGIALRVPGFTPFDTSTPCLHAEAAWTTVCAYATCYEVVDAFDKMKTLLSSFENYRAVFECACGPYGIVIQPLTRGCISEEESRGGIIAVSPQAYQYSDTVCEMITKARGLINREGLHLAEHILLRPLKTEDCECRMRPSYTEFDRCTFPAWQVDLEDPCLADSAVCFQPGHDPYSFIATIALPAWPQRFRKAENRQRVEALLQREAPAHVLLRILWLTPGDMCRYETLLKRWHTWMAYKTGCVPFDSCELINFLTRYTFECLDDAVPCDTCTETTQVTSCLDAMRPQDDQKCHSTWFEQVTELFGWQKYDCMPGSQESAREIVRDVSANTINRLERMESPVAASQPVVELAPVKEEAPIAEATPVKEEAPVDKAIPVEPAPIATPVPETPVLQIPKPKFINARLKAYRDAIADIQTAVPGNELAEKASLLLKAANPPVVDWVKLLSLIEKDLKAAARKKTLTRDQANILLVNLIHFFLDKVAFHSKDVTALEKARTILNALRKQRINLSRIYHQWQAPLVEQYEPGLDTDTIDELFNPE